MVTAISCGQSQAVPDNQEKGNAAENYTGFMDSEISRWTGEPAQDADMDIVGEDYSLYWENTYFRKVIHIIYDSDTSEVECADEPGTDITIIPSSSEGCEIITKGGSSDGQPRVYNGPGNGNGGWGPGGGCRMSGG